MYKENKAGEYLEALAHEMDRNVPGTQNKIETIYIGGGTPTALNKEQLKFLLEEVNDKFDIGNCEEFTIEVNPGDLDQEKAKLLKEYGISRVSFGVQVMDDEMLESLGRRHQVRDVYETADLLFQHQFDNISLDLMYALPNQSVSSFKRSLEEALAFDLPHYATYGLQIEPKTVFYQRYKKGQLRRPAEEEEIEMYEILKETMNKNGIRQYEISNFAKPGFESKHNLTYWNNEYYYGFGAGAHAYVPGKRIANTGILPAYIKQAMTDGKPVAEMEEIHLKEAIEEEMLLGLRRISGLDKNKFKRKFHLSLDDLYKNQLMKLKEQNLLEENEQAIWLTNQGLLLANQVFEKFMLDESNVPEWMGQDN